MKRIPLLWQAVLVLVIGLGFALPATAQTVLTTTTLGAAINGYPTNPAQRTVTVASATGITAGTTGLFLPGTGEYMAVTNVSGLVISVIRGSDGTRAWPAPTSSTVFITQSGSTTKYTPYGACTRGTGLATFQPIINTRTADLAICSLVGAWRVTNQLQLVAPSTTNTP